MKKPKVLFICSVGGHLTELLQLKSLFQKYDYHLVTENTELTKELKDEYKVSFLVFGARNNLFKYIFKFSFH
ncbi:polysaccharide biosynthesis protein, partial [Bacillus rubiinfantis]|uniref:polysaccharide biosynthesis protein n=1 Tax=Bacillus rubiinfantis TaxID=1499680 RepID=UPI0005A7D9A7